MIDGLCVSIIQCTKRLRTRTNVWVVLLNPPVRTPIDEQAKAIRNAYYRYGLCTECGTRPHSAGRPRCESCHRKRHMN